jgi:hypothetical protein
MWVWWCEVMTLLASIGPAKMQMLAVFEAMFLLFIGGL